MTNAKTHIKRGEVSKQYKMFIGRKILFLVICISWLFFASIISLSIGDFEITPLEVFYAVFGRIFTGIFNTTEINEVIIWNIRFPRIIMGMLAGAGLGLAGAVLQGVLKNPLASPFTLGISSGAGFGASLAIIFGIGFIGTDRYLLIGNAFIFALIPTITIIGLSRYKKATPETMILAGVAMGFLFSAATSLLHYFADPEALKAAAVWMMGSFGRATWYNASTLAILLACCFPVLIMKAWDLNTLAAGDETAKSLGINVESTRITLMAVASLATAGIVCFTGTIAFVGLVAPHITRIIIGGDNRFVLPASCLCGAAFLISVDLIARTLISPVIIPVGVMSSFIGGPMFIYFIIRKKKEFW
jgi:iron complex transport system permease protein